jgi:hypothetical protein
VGTINTIRTGHFIHLLEETDKVSCPAVGDANAHGKLPFAPGNGRFEGCRMYLPGPTTSVGTRTDFSVGPWDYPTCAPRHLLA